MAISRRHLIEAAALAGVAGSWLRGEHRAGRRPEHPVHRHGHRRGGAGATGEPFGDPLVWPPYVDGTQPLALGIVTSQHSFSSSLAPAETLAYELRTGTVLAGGALSGYLGPTIVVPTGTSTSVTASNEITHHPLASSLDLDVHGTLAGDAGQARTALHLHGGNTAPAYDGGPLDTFPLDHTGAPGFPNPYTYDYANDQDATALWYHDHALGITRLNAYAGLAAGYLIRDTSATGIDTGDGSMLPAPPYEMPLVLQDKMLGADGSMFYPPAPWVPGFFGDVAVVNGTAFPYLDVLRGVYRFRVFNGSNARFYELALQASPSGALLPFWLIGGDGGLLNAPLQVTRLLVSPGERVDLLVDFREVPSGSKVTMTNSARAPYPGGAPGPGEGSTVLRELMQFRVSPEGATGWTPPGNQPIGSMNLRPVTPVQRLDEYAAGATVRTHSLVDVSDRGRLLVATLDNRPFDSDDYLTKVDPVRPDTVEVWEFVNTTMHSHPIHMHLVQFQVLNRQRFQPGAYLRRYYADHGSGHIRLGTGPYPAPSPTPFLTGPVEPPAESEQGFKGTVHAPPGMVTRVIVPFGQGAVPVHVAARRVYSGDYVWHCHILEHEDNDMMQRYHIAEA